MAKIGELVVKIGADASSLKKGLEDSTKQIAAVGDKMKSIGQSMSTFVTLPILAGAGAAVKLASDMNESINKVDVAFKGSSDKVKSWSDTTLKSFGIARGTALDMAATFGDMATSMGLNTGQASDMSMKLVGLAGDLASFKNISIDVANTALNGVFTGETESLKQLGIVMTQANLQEFAYSQGIKTKVQDMTQAEQVQLRYNYILANTTNAQGDFNRTSAGTANQTRMFGESLKELGATMGTKILPIITPIITKINEWLQKFAQMSPETQKVILIIAGLAAAIGPLLIVIGSIAAALPLLGTAFAVITGPIGLVIAAIAAVIAIGVLLYKNWDEIKAKVATVWQSITDFFTKTLPLAIDTGLKWFSELPEKIVNFINQLPEKIGYWMGLALGKIVQFGIDAVSWAVIEVPKIITSIVDFFKDLPTKIWDWLVAAFKKLGDWERNILTWAKTKLPTVISTIVNFFATLPKSLLDIGVNMVKGLWDGISSMVGWIGDKIRGFVGGIVSGIEDGLDMHSPSRVMADIGKNVTIGLAQGITSVASLVDRSIGGLVDKMTIQPSFSLSGNTGAVTDAISGNTYNSSQSRTSQQVNISIYGNNADEIWDKFQRKMALAGVSL